MWEMPRCGPRHSAYRLLGVSRWKICSSELTTRRVSDDGEVVELGFVDISSGAASVQLPFDQAESLVMTLPHLLARALRKRTGLENARYVFRVGDWSIEGTEEE